MKETRGQQEPQRGIARDSPFIITVSALISSFLEGSEFRERERKKDTQRVRERDSKRQPIYQNCFSTNF